MNFKIKTDDFWLDEDSDLAPALKSYIIREVVRKISDSIAERVEEEVSKKATEAVNEKIAPVIDATIADMIATQTINPTGKEPIPIYLHIKKVFEQNTGWSRPGEQIKKFAESFGKEMKLQYNAAFANQIVVNLKEQGFLKDEVVQALLTKNGPA